MRCKAQTAVAVRALHTRVGSAKPGGQGAPAAPPLASRSGCRDNAQFLSWPAVRTARIWLATGVFILPWNNSLRVAEKSVLLDHLSNGRAVRGLARREYATLGVEMNESRHRFDVGA